MDKKYIKPKSLDELVAMVRKAREEGVEIQFENADTGATGPDALISELEGIGGPGMAASLKDALGFGTGKKLSGQELAHALLDVVALHASPKVYPPGSFVRYREYVRYVRDHQDMHVVVEVLKEPRQVELTSKNDGDCTSYRRYDVIVAKPDSMGGICRYFADSRELELYPDADKFLGKSS